MENEKIDNFVKSGLKYKFYLSDDNIISGIDFSRIFEKGSRNELDIIFEHDLIKENYLLDFIENENFKYYTEHNSIIYILKNKNFITKSVNKLLLSGNLHKIILLFKYINYNNIEQDNLIIDPIFEKDDVNLFCFIDNKFNIHNSDEYINLCYKFQSKKILDFIMINLSCDKKLTLNLDKFDLSFYTYIIECYDVEKINISDFFNICDKNLNYITFLLDNNLFGDKISLITMHKNFSKMDDIILIKLISNNLISNIMTHEVGELISENFDFIENMFKFGFILLED